MVSKIKVIHYIWSANFGGIEKIAIHLASEQNARGNIESALLIGCRKGEFLPLIKQLNLSDYYGDLKNGFNINPVKIIKIKRIFSHYDIIHFHTFNFVVMLAAILSRRKIVYTIHGNFNYGKEIGLSNTVTNFLRKIFLNQFVDFISFNSYWTQKEAISKYRIRLKNHKVIYNGKMPDPSHAVQSVEIAELKDTFVVGTISRFNQSKRIDRLIDAFAKFAGNKKDVRLLVVGDGLKRSSLESQVKKLGIENVSIFPGYQSDTIAFQSLMHVCVFPFANEAFGLVVLDALALGKPTIIFRDAGGTVELFEDQFKDDIVSTVEQLALRLEYYYLLRSQEHPELVNSRKNKASEFKFETMQQQFTECYQSLLNQK